MFPDCHTHKVIGNPMSAPAASIVDPASAAPASEGVPASFEEAYHAWADTAARWAQQLGGSGVDVEDVVQEVFLVVSRQLGRFRGDARFSTWLFEITRKITSNHRQRHRWRFWRTSVPHDPDSAPSASPAPDAELERRQTIDQFYQALDKLPEKYRTLLVLYEIEGMSTQAIADLGGLNLSTVRVQLGRARGIFMKQYREVLGKVKS
jgi:RNA polymerase sigma factor (sigma-70 family)